MNDKQIGVNKLSRRDFLKWGGVMFVGALVFAGTELGIEYGNNPYSMACRVCDKLFQAELNKQKDPESYAEAKKLAFVWIFAETARQHGKRVGFEKAGEALGHYMYGEGSTLDVSKWLEDESENNQDFWPQLFSDARYGIKKEQGIENDVVATKMLKKRLKSGYTFILGSDSSDLFNAIGMSTCELKANLKFEADENEELVINKELSNVSLKLVDKYDWDGKGNPADLGEKGREFISGLFGAVRTLMLNKGEIVIDALNNLNLPGFYLDQLQSIYNEEVFNFLGTLSNKIGGIPLDLEKSLVGEQGVDEKSIALLEEVGAKQYYIQGSIHHHGPVKVDE